LGADRRYTPETPPFAGQHYVGKATRIGLEIEARTRVAQDYTIGLFGGITRATFDEAVAAVNVNDDTELQAVPEWNAALPGDYRYYSNDSVTALLRGAARWVGSSRGSFDVNNPDYSRPFYNTLDVGIGAGFEGWEFSLFGKKPRNDQTNLQWSYVQFLLRRIVSDRAQLDCY
jgi:outer membrane receptor protein involved in Fe transport